MSNSPLFVLRDVRQRYGDKTAVAIDHLELQSNHVFCLLGPTGAGKSTLLRLLAAVEQPHGGTIQWHDHKGSIASLSLTARRRLTMVFQRPLLLRGTVRWNLEYGLRLRRVADPQRVDEILDRLGLHEIANQAAGTLSGGQTQLVALARALVVQPDVLLLDEPTANLDPARVDLVERVIREDAKQRGSSTIWATHNLFQARRVADRVALMLDGQFIEVDNTDTFFNHPSDSRTRDFVEGRMIY